MKRSATRGPIQLDDNFFDAKRRRLERLSQVAREHFKYLRDELDDARLPSTPDDFQRWHLRLEVVTAAMKAVVDEAGPYCSDEPPPEESRRYRRSAHHEASH